MRGLFVFVDVPAGTYAVVVERAGFKKAQVLDVQVNVDKPAILTVHLEAGGLTETVTVTASEARSLIRSEDGRLSTTVDVSQVQDLPLNERNAINIAGGLAGVNTNTNISPVRHKTGCADHPPTLPGTALRSTTTWCERALFGVNTPSVAAVAEFQLTTQNEDGWGICSSKAKESARWSVLPRRNLRLLSQR